MILIDLVFLAVLINAGIGAAYMKWWTKYSKGLEERSEYMKVYQLLRIAILFFTLPGLLSLPFTGRIWGAGIAPLLRERAWGQVVLLLLLAAAFVWIAGAIRRTYRYLKAVRRFCRICEYNEEIEQEHLKEYFEHICKRQHIYKEVTVYANSRIQVPVIFGVLKRTILLPASCSTPEELQIILEHEMIHAKHNDLLMERIAAVLHLVLWFLPEPKQLLDKLEEWSETICDISVCASEDSVWNKKQYFTLLLHWAQEEKAAGSGAVLALSGESSGIRTRIMRMHRYEQAGSGRLNRNLSSGLWLTGCCICIILGIVFGIQKMGQSISAQVYTAHLLEQTGIGSGVRNSDIRLKGSCVVAEGKENKHLLYLKEGEHICVYYDADLYDADAASEMDKEVFGMVGMEAVLGDVTMECPGILGQDTAGFAVNESGWYLFTVKNHFEGQDIGIDYIIVKG